MFVRCNVERERLLFRKSNIRACKLLQLGVTRQITLISNLVVTGTMHIMYLTNKQEVASWLQLLREEEASAHPLFGQRRLF